MTLQGEPYSGIKAACMKICGELLYLKQNNRNKFKEIHSTMLKGLDDELGLLMELIPDLGDVFADEGDPTRGSNDALILPTPVTKQSKMMLHDVFLRFIRLVASHFSPFVIVLDDLQRADKPSLELLRSIISDNDTSALILIGTYRSDEVDDTLSDFLQGIRKSSVEDSYQYSVTEMELKNFTSDKVKGILEILLNTDDSPELTGLATLCYRRTLGNIFHLECFLRALYNRELLKFTIGLNKWKWDEDAILASTEATMNVVDLTRQRLKEVPIAVQRRISVAACLGAKFDTETLGIVWKEVSTIIDDDEAIEESWLIDAENNGIFDEIGDSEYQWAHDNVQEAAMSLIAQDDLPRHQALIGRALLNHLPVDKKEKYMFSAVDLLNSGEQSVSGMSRLELAKLNCKAAKKAAEQVGVESMDHYSRLGIENLPEHSWKDHYELSLELKSLAAEAASVIGKVDLLISVAQEILDQKERPIMDKIRAYKSLIHKQTRSDDSEGLAEAVTLCREALSALGCTFPKPKFGHIFYTVTSLLKMKKMIKQMSEDDIQKMPPMVDPVDLQICELLASSMDLVTLTEPTLLGLWILRMAEITLNRGFCKYTPSAFSQLGILFVNTGDDELALKCAIFAENMKKTSEFKSVNAIVAYQIYGFSLAYKRLYYQVLPRLWDGYKDALAAGDLNSGGAVSTICRFRAIRLFSMLIS